MEPAVVQNVNFSRQLIEAALCIIAKLWRLSTLNVANYRKLGTIEGCAHELAHALDLGPDFEVLIRAMEDNEANQHEAAVLRIEMAALAALGVHLSMRRLRAAANWRSLIRIPSHIQLQASLNSHERDCVRRFVDMISYEIKHMSKNQEPVRPEGAP